MKDKIKRALSQLYKSDLRNMERMRFVGEVRDGIAELEKQKNYAYEERNMLVSALSKLFPSYLAEHQEDEDWEDDWRNIVFIELPTGQVSWHIHDSELKFFSHLEYQENKWDGHNTKEKYRRLGKLK